MTIALSVAINVSVRTITSLSRSTRSDTASRSLAAAEGGIERFLNLQTAELDDVIDGDCPDGIDNAQGGGCIIEFDSSSDTIISKATVTVAQYQPTDYHLSINNGEVKEINLYNESTGTYYGQNTITVCWTGENNQHADLVYTSYASTGILVTGGLTSSSLIGGSEHDENGYIVAGGGNGRPYTNCVENLVLGGNAAYGLRLRALYKNVDVGIYPANSATLPMQGYEITSVGTLVQDTGVTATKKIKIIRSLPYLSGAFENALYTLNGLVK